ncbi:MAG: hypothetical protein K1X95_09625 [Acidimicrobiia bacterium]|nr:hypothetical protein [Acidimicrobiia bacterium]
MGSEPADVSTVDDGDVGRDEVDVDDELTWAERILPASALGRWAIYLVIVAVVAAVLWFWVFPPLQHLLPEGF